MKQGLIKDWQTQAGLRAAIWFGALGHYCGYVGVSEGHPLHGVGYRTPCAALTSISETTPMGKRGVFTAIAICGDDARRSSPEAVFNVHGGLTYASGSANYPVASDNLWWFGYDCGHCYDAPHPDFARAYQSEGEFRDEAYCIAECESLARQIFAATQITA